MFLYVHPSPAWLYMVNEITVSTLSLFFKKIKKQAILLKIEQLIERQFIIGYIFLFHNQFKLISKYNLI